MFTYLKLDSHKGLDECVLRDLGRINIICGKNNSGKSTLLEVIANKNARTVGRKFGDAELNQLSAIGPQNFLYHGSNAPHPQKSEVLKRLLEKTIAEKDVWYENDLEQFREVFDALFARTGLRWAANAGLLNRAFLNLFSSAKDSSTVLLPPKRLLQLTGNIRTSEDVEPNGTGLLNYLLYARNQDESSTDSEVLRRIKESFTKISSGFRFDVFLGRNNDIQLNFAHKGGTWVKAEDCGLGLQDLLVILYFAIHPSRQVILIEEPESHLHPDLQRRLLYFLREETNKQFFMTTHSNVFLNNALLDRVFFTSFRDRVIVDDATSRASILDDIGYSVTDNLVSDLIILVEGPKDSPIIEEYLIKLGLYDAYDIKTWPLGGDIMAQVDLSVFAEKYSIIGLIDHDPGSDHARKIFLKKCKDLEVPVVRLKRYAIENYFSLRALREVFRAQIRDDIVDIDPATKLEDQIGLDVKNNNRRLARAMFLEEIEDTDLYQFLLEVKNICELSAKSGLESKQGPSSQN